MEIRCRDHVHHVEVSLVSEPHFDRADSEYGFNSIGQVFREYEFRAVLQVDGMNAQMNIPMRRAQQDTSLILTSLLRCIHDLFPRLAPCLQGNVPGWAQFALSFLGAFPGIQYTPDDARRFMGELGRLVSRHTDFARRIENDLRLRPLPPDWGEVDARIRANDEMVARAFQLPCELLEREYVVRNQAEANIAANVAVAADALRTFANEMYGRGFGPTPSDAKADETALALFESTLPWAATMM